MDAIVEAALRKWPHVPHVRGWLGLDARGHWWLRDEAAQAAGPWPASRGSRIEHPALVAFIGRNYAADAHGAWYFQNGPQRVYVELEAAPWVWRVHVGADGGVAVTAHTGAAAAVRSVWLDEHGRVFLDTDLGFGLVHSLDTDAAALALERGAWPAPQTLPFAAMPQRFGYRLSPQRDAG
ncbi:DUF2946 family protein [Azohydromonas sediminis]|uniref:DUF2946 family protein n=1 Tax=Azohydromonas sediminis TaxID=2259674 RepID=UPI000E6577D2|nr:DUF2946 family protein [Azohydromonas sediminis]